MTIRRRLVLLSTVAVAVAIALASAVVYVVVRGNLRSQVDEALRADQMKVFFVSVKRQALADAGVPLDNLPVPPPGTGVRVALPPGLRRSCRSPLPPQRSRSRARHSRSRTAT